MVYAAQPSGQVLRAASLLMLMPLMLSLLPRPAPRVMPALNRPPIAAAEARIDDDQAAPAAAEGTLRFAAAVDLDGDARTNPAPDTRVPVVRVGTPGMLL